MFDTAERTNTLLVDFSNLAYCSLFSALKADGIKADAIPPDYTNYIYPFHQRVEGWMQNFRISKLVFALDQWPKSKAEIFPKYKQQRKKLEHNPKTALLQMIRNWNCITIESQNMEADDAMASYVTRSYETENITIISTDKDMWQLLDHPNTSVYNFISNYFVSPDKVLDAFDIEEYRHIKLVKALLGDPGDNVPNLVPRQGKHLLPYVKQSDGTLDQFWKILDGGEFSKLPKKCQEVVEKNREQININYDLVRLHYSCPLITTQYPLPQVNAYAQL